MEGSGDATHAIRCSSGDTIFHARVSSQDHSTAVSARMKRSIARDSVSNLLVQILVAGVALACVPAIVQLLGVERFGLLSILWLFVGYLGLLDLGVGAASVKFLSEHLARNETSAAAETFRLAVKISAVLSGAWFALVLGLLLIGIDRFLQIPGDLRAEARHALLVLALCVPAVVLQGAFRGVLFAFRRFDVVNLIQGVSGTLLWGGALLVLSWGGGLLGVGLLTLAIRYAGLAASLLVCRRIFPAAFSGARRVARIDAGQLLRFGGWVTVSQVISPIVVLLERLVIANVLTLGWLSYFAVPNDAIMRLAVIPMSLATALLPALSSGWADQGARAAVKGVYMKALKFAYLLMVPIGAVLIVFHNEILLHWMGTEFMLRSGLILCLFAIGIVFHSVAQVPNATLQALGRPDVAAKLLVVELPAYALVVYLLTRDFGIEGTAFAWMVRVAIEAGVLLRAVYVLMRNAAVRSDVSYWWKAVAASGLAMGAIAIARNVLGADAGIVALLFSLPAYAAAVWFLFFDQDDRSIVNRLRSSN